MEKKPNDDLPPHLRKILEKPVEIIPVNWMDKITLPENPKTLRQLADEYPRRLDYSNSRKLGRTAICSDVMCIVNK